ncbi:MAG: hypothetical protein V9G19_20190 [Tetrasphaera sp.]
MVRHGEVLTLPRLGSSWRINELLGQGGQGSVYLIRAVDGSQRQLALKWYAPSKAMQAQREAIGALVQRGSPSPAFLWPIDIVDQDDSFGYAMALRPPGFVGLGDLMRGRVEVGVSIALRICVGLSDAFLQLHSLGLCYRDISLGNIMFDPNDGRVIICDNDNVGLDGSEGVVLGTRRFMAPEIVTGRSLPSIQTDLHSLAVMIFYVLMVGHPLLGKREQAYSCLDEGAERELFGHKALFVFDPASSDNAPDPAEQATMLANWELQPDGIRALFTKAFTSGLVRPDQRVRESAWRKELATALDHVLACPSCTAENVLRSGPTNRCWYCGGSIAAELALAVGRSRVLVGAGACVTQHHLRHDYVVNKAVGEFVKHPQKDVWGLRNLSPSAWHATIPGRAQIEVPQERAIAMVPGTSIDFGGATGRVEELSH